MHALTGTFMSNQPFMKKVSYIQGRSVRLAHFHFSADDNVIFEFKNKKETLAEAGLLLSKRELAEPKWL